MKNRFTFTQACLYCFPMKRILAIDDEPLMLRCVESALQDQGYEIQTTSNAETGLKIAREDKTLALVTLDVRMPGKDGFEMYREIRKHSQVPILFITAYPKSVTDSNADSETAWTESIADDHTEMLYKPFRLPALFEKVKQMIGPAATDPETR